MNEKDIFKLIRSKEQGLRENLLPSAEVKILLTTLWDFLDKNLSGNSIEKLRYQKLKLSKPWNIWSNSAGYVQGDPWKEFIEPFFNIFEQYLAGKTIKNKLSIDKFFVESRAQGEDQHILVGERDGSGKKAHVVIDHKTGEIRVDDKDEAPEKVISKIETILTLKNGKKIRSTREALEELQEESPNNTSRPFFTPYRWFLIWYHNQNMSSGVKTAFIGLVGTVLAALILGSCSLISGYIQSYSPHSDLKKESIFSKDDLNEALKDIKKNLTVKEEKCAFLVKAELEKVPLGTNEVNDSEMTFYFKNTCSMPIQNIKSYWYLLNIDQMKIGYKENPIIDPVGPGEGFYRKITAPLTDFLGKNKFFIITIGENNQDLSQVYCLKINYLSDQKKTFNNMLIQANQADREIILKFLKDEGVSNISNFLEKKQLY